MIEILEYSGMINKSLQRLALDNTQYVLDIVDNKILPNKDKQPIINLPTKLPMICEPKSYTKSNLGGYLLNDIKFTENLFIEKKAYGINSVLFDNNNNIIYDLINKISKTPFKINVTLLDYLINNGYKYDLLIDPTIKHKYADIEKRTKHQQTKYASHNSKIILQETIIGIAQFYSKYSKIYFPVRLDQRGRIYCSPNFINYQSN